MKILLVSLHVRNSPQAVALAAANLKAALPAEDRDNTRMLDFELQQSLADMLVAIRATGAALIAFSLYLWNRQRVLELVAALKQQPDPPFILLGGPEASADTRRLLEGELVDAVLRGEGEEGFRELVACLKRGADPSGISGLCLSPERIADTACCDLEHLPSPWLSDTLRPVAGGVLWEVARGCPFRCSFCYDAKGMAGVRPLPFERLSAELETFVRQGVEQVWVLDSTFNAPPRRGKQLLRLLHNKAPQLHFHLEAKAEFIDAETITLLEQLSCSLQLGLQTADAAVLAGLNRNIDPKRFWSGVEQVSNSGLTFGLDLIYGLPGDSYQGVMASIEQALAYRPNQLDIFPLAVLPGTELHAQKELYQLRCQALPPYLLRSSEDFSARQLESCAEWKATVDLFYNRGRAVAFFLPFCAALQVSALQLLEEFRDWRIEQTGSRAALLEHDALDTAQIFDLQREFLETCFRRAGRSDLWPLASDVLIYHYHYAEALLGCETLPALNEIAPEEPLQLAAGVRLIEFGHEILGAMESEEIDLPRWKRLLKPAPSWGLMIRRGREILCEELEERFVELLSRARHPQSALQLLRGFEPELGDELLQFALQEGLLEPAVT